MIGPGSDKNDKESAYKKKMLKVACSKFSADGKTNGYGQSYQSADGGGWIVVATSRKNKNMERNTSDTGFGKIFAI